ncbi:MAG: hypothetical protein IH867_06700 [Chloroflexi bacterium]|nr:hypothetical protein [Chloroflexota bacterium]
MQNKFRPEETKHAVRISPGLLVLCGALAIMLVAAVACSSSEGTTAETKDSDAPESSLGFDLSDMDAATTEAEIIRLLGEGHVMYTRFESFARGGIFVDNIACASVFRYMPQVVCDGYPETVIEEWWESTDSSGTVSAYYGRMTTLDGVLLATGIQGEWTDIASGEEWSAGRREGRELVQDVETTFTVIERAYARGGIGTEGEFLGRPSIGLSTADEYRGRPNVSFDDQEFVYQVANPFLYRQTTWIQNGDGTRGPLRESSEVLDFAMLPPGSLPEFAVMPEPVELDVPNLSERFDLSGMDAATIEAEIIRLLGEGHVMYLRMERFGWGGAYTSVCRPPVTDFSRPKVVCEGYPGRIVRETWESTDPSGVVRVSYGRESKLDGTVLAIKTRGEWTDIASGETWLDGMREDRNLIEGVEDRFTSIQRERDRGLDGVESEYLGKPSINFAGVFEYQVANPMLWRQVHRQELGDGMRTILSEARFTDFAMLPPDSFPGFATSSGG